MEQRVSIITLGVADLKRSREFYERLGWRRSMAKAEGVVFFQAGGMALALYPRYELAKDANVAPHGDGFRGISLAYNARNRGEVDSVLEDAEAAGAKLLKAGQEAILPDGGGRKSSDTGIIQLLAFSFWLRTQAAS